MSDAARPEVRRDYSRAEAIGGLFWLVLGALLSLLLEVVYLGATIPIGDGHRLPFPVTILIAFGFNWVLARTARLWNACFTSSATVTAVPVVAWVLGFLFFAFSEALGGDQMLGNNIRTVLLFLAGILGGVWPVFGRK